MKFLPEGADTDAASARTTVNDSLRAEIEAKLATRAGPGVVPVCRICKGLTAKTPLQVWRHLPYIRLPGQLGEIVWHLRCWYVRGVPCGEMHAVTLRCQARVSLQPWEGVREEGYPFHQRLNRKVA